MATYVIGDVQGCYEPLMRLIERVEAHASCDRLWFVGDLVNRGPDSLSVLRWLYRHRDEVDVVLGNHDLHLLACALGLSQPRPSDTLSEVLDAPDVEELIGWLRCQPLWFRDDRFAMVHAGLHPQWTLDDIEVLAHELQVALGGERIAELLLRRPTLQGHQWSAGDPEPLRLRAALSIFTRLRCLGPGDSLTFDFTGPLSALPEGRSPWWTRPHRRDLSVHVITGHWAALGVHRAQGVTSIDSGCVWGRELSALCLDDGMLFSSPAQVD